MLHFLWCLSKNSLYRSSSALMVNMNISVLRRQHDCLVHHVDNHPRKRKLCIANRFLKEDRSIFTFASQHGAFLSCLFQDPYLEIISRNHTKGLSGNYIVDQPPTIRGISKKFYSIRIKNLCIRGMPIPRRSSLESFNGFCC